MLTTYFHYNYTMIGLMDCNNFFVSCERLFRPDLQKVPVAVLSSNDGCIVARSQEIKDLGIPMGIPYFQVKDVLTQAHAVLFSSNFTLYRDISTRVMNTLKDEVGFCDVYSIDEAFFEVSDDATDEDILAIRTRVMKNVGLPVSIGVAKTKTLAKQASALAKKSSGVCILNDESAQQIENLPCSSVWGLGRQTSAKLKEKGVVTIGDFLKLERRVVRRDFGVSGERIYSELHGICVYELGTNSEDIQQSIMSTRSFEKTTNKLSELESAVAYHVNFASEKLREKQLVASRIYVLMQASRHGDFFMRKASSEAILTLPTSDSQELLHQALTLVRNLYDSEVPYKKAGVVLSSLLPESQMTQTLFNQEATQKNTTNLDTITDLINTKFGNGTVRPGVILKSGSRGSQKLRSKEYTTSWKDIPTVSAK